MKPLAELFAFGLPPWELVLRGSAVYGFLFLLFLLFRFVEPPPIVLVRRGRLIGRNLHRQYITVPQLMASLRAEGVEKLADVKLARLESDGSISVIHAARGAGGAAR